MRRFLCLILALSFCLCACGKKTEEKEGKVTDFYISGFEDAVPSDTTEQEEKEPTVSKLSFAAVGDNIIYQCGFTDAKNRANSQYPEYNFMSPEWNIDASTCAFPFRTWFIKNVGHSTSPGEYEVLSKEIIHDNIDVFTYENRPQFLLYDEESGALEALKAPEEEEETFYDKIFAVFRKLFLLPKTIFDKLFGRK